MGSLVSERRQTHTRTCSQMKAIGAPSYKSLSLPATGEGGKRRGERLRHTEESF